MNLREPSDSGFPKRDLVPARILTEEMDCSQAVYTARCCALFAAIFHTLQQDLSAKVSSLHSDSTGAAIKYWNNRMCDMRSPARAVFFEKVQTRYQVVSTNNDGHDRRTEAEVLNRSLTRLARRTRAKRAPIAMRQQLRRPLRNSGVCL
jgi:hypothetical protein